VWLFSSRPRPRFAVSGLFLVVYGVARFILEFWRVPDDQLGYVWHGWLTRGQELSFPMVLAGLIFLIVAYRSRTRSGNFAVAQPQ
jgi:phosphatidylglycerol---prolipoprotein diacylglyceryl transferase